MSRTRTAAAIATIAAALTACHPNASSESTNSINNDTTAMLKNITIAAEDTGYDYDRDDWPHWSHVGDYCNVRDVVLKEQAEQVRVGDKCALTGRWVSPYDDVVVTDPSDLDIDHIVPLSEVADSGVRDWTEAERETFANDTRFLVAVTASSNRSKGDQDPAEWMPPNPAYHCEYVELWVEAKAAYELTMDRAEADKVRQVLADC